MLDKKDELVLTTFWGEIAFTICGDETEIIIDTYSDDGLATLLLPNEDMVQIYEFLGNNIVNVNSLTERLKSGLEKFKQDEEENWNDLTALREKALRVYPEGRDYNTTTLLHTIMSQFVSVKKSLKQEQSSTSFTADWLRKLAGNFEKYDSEHIKFRLREWADIISDKEII